MTVLSLKINSYLRLNSHRTMAKSIKSNNLEEILIQWYNFKSFITITSKHILYRYLTFNIRLLLLNEKKNKENPIKNVTRLNIYIFSINARKIKHLN